MATSKPPPSQYFGFHYKWLRVLGIGRFHHPEENNFNNYPNKAYLIYGILCTCINVIGYTASETLFAVKVWQDGREASLQFLAFTMVGVHIFAVIKILILISNNKKIQKIVRVLEVESKRFHGDPLILKHSMFLTKVVTGCFFIMGEITITLMSVYTITLDIDRKKRLFNSNYTLEIPRDTPFTAYVPWDTSEDLPYAGGFIYCVFGMYWMGTTLIICDTMIASIMAHISGQFRMVQKVIENIGENAVEMLTNKMHENKRKNIKDFFTTYEENNSELIEQNICEFSEKKKRVLIYCTEEEYTDAMIICIKEAIQYHQLIIGITEDLQTAYSNAFMCQTLSSFYVIGLILVQTAQDVSNIYSLRFVNTVGFLISILWQLFSQTYSANEITLEAAKVSGSAFGSRWYSATKDNVKVGRLLVVLLQRANRPLYLTAGKFAPMSNDLFVTIIKNAYQIFTLITTVMSGDK